LIINKDAFATLPEDLQSIVETAARAVNQDMLDEYTARNNEALVSLVETHGVQLRKLPDEVISELRDISSEMLEELASDSDIARRIADSVQSFQQQAATYHAISEEAYYEARKAD
jgi:TRAP-type mannitol/chloroaromatic compound transport system substrate-binding protein